MKYTIVILNQINIKKIKSIKDNFGKNHKKTKGKKNYARKHCSNL
jgi:hypothetical protein